MKKKDKLKLIKYAIKDYNEMFDRDYKPVYKSAKDIKSLLKEYPYASMAYWFYCCDGLYVNCWQDPIEEGVWGLTREDVYQSILNVFTSKLLRVCKRENRMFWYEKDSMIHMVIIARDLRGHKADYLIVFSKEIF